MTQLAVLNAKRESAPMIEPSGESRDDRLQHLRREIALGTYDTSERLEAAVEAFLSSPDARRPASATANLAPRRMHYGESIAVEQPRPPRQHNFPSHASLRHPLGSRPSDLVGGAKFVRPDTSL